MNHYSSRSPVSPALAIFGGFLGFILILELSSLIIGTFCWPYSINTWLIYCHKTAAITWWQGTLISIVPGIGHLSLITAIITWVAMLFLG